MKKILTAVMAMGMMSSVLSAGVQEVYVGSTTDAGPQYVIKCTNGNSINGVHQESDGYWYSVSSNMGDNYKNQSIDGVAATFCQ